MNRSRFLTKAFLVLILVLAFSFRIYGLNWDQDQHLHPDERFLTMVANSISWPKSLPEYFDTQNSPLNPHNKGYGFFVYGTFPLFLVKAVAESQGLGDYGHLTLVGRLISAFFDLGTLILVFLIAKMMSLPPCQPTPGESLRATPGVNNEKKLPFLATLFYALSVLPIQLSHFFTVDTFLVFFLTLSFYLLVKLVSCRSFPLITNYQLLITVLLGFSFGLALACKISALIFLPIIILGLFFYFYKKTLHFNQKRGEVFVLFVFHFLLFTLGSYFSFRLGNPYAFANKNFFNPAPNPKFIANLKTLKSFDNPSAFYPPAVQWIKTKPFIYPARNILYWGLGLPLGILSFLGLFYALFRLYVAFRKHSFLKTANLALLLIVCFVILLFGYQGARFAKVMRYFYPLYPFFSILGAFLVSPFFQKIKSKLFTFSLLLFTFILVYPLSFLSIYSQPHSRVLASIWIYKNIPKGSTLACEHWDDCLPLPLTDKFLPRGKNFTDYETVSLSLYDQDAPQKWEKMTKLLDKADYVILSSNRLYGSIASVPKRYPIASRYYQALFDRSLGFKKVAEITSRPNIPIPLIRLCFAPPGEHYGFLAKKTQECQGRGLTFVDDYADESFTVYDHPKVIIFKKTKNFSITNLKRVLNW